MQKPVEALPSPVLMAARYLNEREARGDRSDPGFGVLVPWSLHTQLLMLVARAAGAGILFDHAMLERPRTEQ
jgi:hypothetical protein